MCLLFKLPEMVAVSVLVSWVGVKDLGRLDSAMCNKMARKPFLKLVSQPAFVIQNPWRDSDEPSDVFVTWIMRRFVTVSALSITDSLLRSRSERQKYLKHCGKHVHSVDVRFVPGDGENCAELFRDLCENCPNVSGAVCDEDLPPAAQAHIAAHWKQLADLTTEVGVAGQEFVSLGENCQSLGKLTLWGSSEASHHVPVAFFEVVSPHLSDLTAGDLLLPEHYKALANRCYDLKKLTVRDGALNDEALIAVAAGCRALHWLRMYDVADVTDAGLVAIAHNGALTTLFVDGCNNITDAGLQTATAYCPLLQCVSLAGCTQLTNDTLIALGQHCHHLRTLNISYTDVTDGGLEATAAGCPLLEELSMATCASLTDVALFALGQHCHNLRKLHTDETDVTHAGLAAVAAGCPLLEELTASESAETGSAIEAIAKNCPRLRKLRARDTDVSPGAVLALAECCPLLEDLYLCYSKRVGDVEITALARGCPRLKWLTIAGTSVKYNGLCAVREHLKALRRIDLSSDMFPGAVFDDDFFPEAVIVTCDALTL
jgi:hypothetical protein